MGEIYFSLLLATAAAVKARLGFGTWTAWGAGTVLGLRGGAFGASGGAATVTLSEANLAAHTHPGSTATPSLTWSQSGGTMSGTAHGGGSTNGESTTHIHDIELGEILADLGGTSYAVAIAAGGVSTGANDTDHTHVQNDMSVDGSVTVSGSISGSVTLTIASDGSATPFSIVPSYTAVYAWLRTA